MNIAVTGGYGSGKSSVSRLLVRYFGVQPVSSDSLCRLLLEPGQQGYLQLQEACAGRFLRHDGTVNRPLLRQATFTDAGVKEALEAILHPLVRSRVCEQAKICHKQRSFLLVEVPLLFEVGWQDDFDTTVLVRADQNTAVKRAVQRDNICVDEARRIIAMQLPMSYKEDLVDYIIDNNGGFVSTVQQVAWLVRVLTRKAMR